MTTSDAARGGIFGAKVVLGDLGTLPRECFDRESQASEIFRAGGE
jgi:hypothetical protein